jgi:hypothetical protein
MPKRPTADVDLPAPALEAFDDEQVRFAREAWPMRAAQELRSALIFGALARAARRAHFAEPWPSRFDGAARLRRRARAARAWRRSRMRACGQRRSCSWRLRSARRSRCTCFVQAVAPPVERLVVPRLTRLGLDGPRAWSDRYR